MMFLALYPSNPPSPHNNKQTKKSIKHRTKRKITEGQKKQGGKVLINKKIKKKNRRTTNIKRIFPH